MFKRLIAMLVVICFTGTTQAVMIATPTDRSQLLGVLDRVEVQNQLQAHGVSIEQAKARIAALTDAEAAQLAAQIDSLPAGGDAGVGALITAASDRLPGAAAHRHPRLHQGLPLHQADQVGCRTASRAKPRPTCSSTPATRSTGTRGATRRSARARGEDKPILLSIGYSACHWCHVDGARELRGCGGRRGDESPVRQHQGRPRGAARPRPDLPERAPDARAAHRRLAADDVSLARRHAVLRRHLLSEGAALRHAGVCRSLRARRRALEGESAPRSRRRMRKWWRRSAARCRSRRPGRSLCPATSVTAMIGNLRASFDAQFGGFGGAPKFPIPPTSSSACGAASARSRSPR